MGPLNKTDTIIQLGDQSTILTKGALENVEIQVSELIFPADVYILDMNNFDISGKKTQLL